MKKAITIFLLFIFSAFVVSAHSGKAKYHAVVDVDSSLSSINALAMILANNEVEVLAVLTNSLEAQSKVAKMMKAFYHDGVPVFDLSDNEKAKIIIKGIVKNEPDSITYLGFCGLHNISLFTALDVEQIKISQIIAFEDTKKLKSKEMKSIISFFSDNRIPVNLISGNVLLKDWNPDFLYNPYVDNLIEQYKKNNEEFLLEKELIPVFLKDASSFVQTKMDGSPVNHYEFNKEKSINKFFDKTLKRDFSNENKVFSTFPQDKSLFSDDVRQIMDESMFEHGYSEWRACVITNELHGHLGIYAVVGAKMGIRVREYFHVGVDDVHINSYAGSTPPFSCLNDGLQVSTGGTVGHGLIEVDKTAKTKPAATFRFKNQEVYLELKPEYWEQIKEDIAYGVKTYGLGSEKYWEYVRKLALKYWHDWDRHHIFILN